MATQRGFVCVDICNLIKIVILNVLQPKQFLNN